MNQKNYFMVISVNVGVDTDKKNLNPKKGEREICKLLRNLPKGNKKYEIYIKSLQHFPIEMKLKIIVITF